MKKSISLFALTVLISMVLQSCCKREMPPVSSPVITNVNTTLQENQPYQFTLPNNTNGQSYNIVTPPSHSNISYISTDGSGNTIYQYTPELNYTGTDNISISNNNDNVQPVCGNCNSGCHAGGSCFQHTCCHHQQCIHQNIINITLNIKPKTTPASIVSKEEAGIK